MPRPTTCTTKPTTIVMGKPTQPRVLVLVKELAAAKQRGNLFSVPHSISTFHCDMPNILSLRFLRPRLHSISTCPHAVFFRSNTTWSTKGNAEAAAGEVGKDDLRAVGNRTVPTAAVQDAWVASNESVSFAQEKTQRIVRIFDSAHLHAHMLQSH
eukprot:TRINITY_DN2834_c0_g1_i2.p1 TRINITY_DN2834_c0_g1~~TRINITY_DN2834_c0_g1_i2.p1  ORF type:complete len:155 (+),score=20.99 TRINITY_DN2834_c0_g1_i2:131-595(+)